MGLALLLWNKTVLLARHLHPWKTTLFIIFSWDLSTKQEIWLLQIQLRWLCLTSYCSTVQKPCKQSFTSHSALFKQGCQWLFLSERESLPQKTENLKDIWYTVFSITSSASVVSLKNTQYLNQIVSLNTFFPPFEINVFYILHPCLPISMMEEYQ